MLLSDILHRSVEQWGNQTAMRMRMGYRTVSLTYSEVYETAHRIAAFLESKGLNKGDKVLLLAPNSPYWGCIYWGCVVGGYVVVPLNVQSTGEMVRKIAEQTEAKVMFKHMHFAEKLPDSLRIFMIDFLPELLEGIDASDRPETSAQPDDTVELLYTSGTTGDPKGVILTHRNFCSNLEALSKIFVFPQGAKCLSILPLGHSFEETVGFLLPFYSGAEIVYAHSPAAIRDLLKEHRITHMVAVPAFLQLLMRRIEEEAGKMGKKKQLERMLSFSKRIGIKSLQRLLFASIHRKLGGKLHTIASGGAALDPALEERWALLGFNILQGYGLTETSPIVSVSSYSHKRLGAVGKVLPDVEVRLGEENEIQVKGPNVFQGYYRDEEKTRASFTEDGWFKTGDIGKIDEDGFLYIRGRKKYMIKGPGAQNVYPEDIEEVLNHIEGVRDSCVVGLEKEGQAEIHAVLLLKEDTDPKNAEHIVEEANEQLASFQRITGWSVWPEDDFPRSATRKVQKEKVLAFLHSRKEEGITEGIARTPLTQLLAHVSGVPAEQIHDQSNLARDLHIDSLLRIELIARIEERFGVEIEEARITEKTTVADLDAIIRSREPVKHYPLSRWPRSPIISCLRIFLQLFIVIPLFRIVMRLKVEGAEQLKDLPLPAVFMPNHISYLDSAAVLMALPLRIRWRLAFAAARDVVYEHFKRTSPLLELLFNSFPFPRKEGENIKEGLEHMGQLLDDDCSIVVYPEGGMSETGELLPFKRGAGLVAVEMDAHVVPVKISGTSRIMPYAKLMPRRRGTVTVTFGEPMQFKRSDSYIEVTKKLEEVMRIT